MMKLKTKQKGLCKVGLSMITLLHHAVNNLHRAIQFSPTKSSSDQLIIIIFDKRHKGGRTFDKNSIIKI
jgi:hypothetical protein